MLTTANAVLGFGQLSLAKYLLIVADEDNPSLDIHNIPAFLRHLLERVNWQRDLHFQTLTTMDTLDYSAEGLNKGSKVVIAAAGAAVRVLSEQLPQKIKLPQEFTVVKSALPGVLVFKAPTYSEKTQAEQEIKHLADALENQKELTGWPLIVLADDSTFTAENLDNFLWVTFTRSDPASDIYGVGSFIKDKHWGCAGPLIIDARIKPHHAPLLESDPQVVKSVEALAAPGKYLHGII